MKTVCIVGAGVAGVYLAEKLSAHQQICVHVYERAKQPGGRWRSKKLPLGDGKTEILLEAGAWRLSSRHSRVLKWLGDIQTRNLQPIQYGHKKLPEGPVAEMQMCPPGCGLSNRDHRTFAHGAEFARTADVRTGYPGQDRGSCRVAEVYGARADGKDVEQTSATYSYPKEGFEALLQKKCEALRAKTNVTFFFEHHVRVFNHPSGQVHGWTKKKREAHNARTEIPKVPEHL